MQAYVRLIDAFYALGRMADAQDALRQALEASTAFTDTPEFKVGQSTGLWYHRSLHASILIKLVPNCPPKVCSCSIHTPALDSKPWQRLFERAGLTAVSMLAGIVSASDCFVAALHAARAFAK